MKTNTEFCLAKETSMDWPCLRHDGLLHEITEGRMRGKPTTGRIQMLHDLANDDGFVALKRAAEDREGWKHKVGCQLLLTMMCIQSMVMRPVVVVNLSYALTNFNTGILLPQKFL